MLDGLLVKSQEREVGRGEILVVVGEAEGSAFRDDDVARDCQGLSRLFMLEL